MSSMISAFSSTSSSVLLVVIRIVPEGLDVGLDDDVNERLEEVEYQPEVDHLDVGGWRQVGADTGGENK